jgi:hypothetical protein
MGQRLLVLSVLLVPVGAFSNDARHAYAPPSLREDSTQFVHVMGINPNCVGLPLAGILVISL